MMAGQPMTVETMVNMEYLYTGHPLLVKVENLRFEIARQQRQIAALQRKLDEATQTKED